MIAKVLTARDLNFKQDYKFKNQRKLETILKCKENKNFSSFFAWSKSNEEKSMERTGADKRIVHTLTK